MRGASIPGWGLSLWLVAGGLAARADEWSLTRPEPRTGTLRSPDASAARSRQRELRTTHLARGELEQARAAHEAAGGGLREWAHELAKAGWLAEAAAVLDGTPPKVLSTSDLALSARWWCEAGEVERGVQRLERGPRRTTSSALQEAQEVCYRQAGKLDILATQLESAPGLAQRRQAAALWVALGDQERSESSYRRILESAPGDEQALRGLAGVLERAGRPADAVVIYQQLLRQSPANVELLEHTLDLLREIRRPGEALALLSRSERHSDPTLLRVVARRYAELQDEAARARVLGRVASRASPQEAALIAAEQALEQGRRDDAVVLFSKMVARRGPRAEQLAELAHVLEDHGLIEDALHAQEEALALSPNHARWQEQRALLLERSGQTQAAERAWQQLLAMQLPPDMRREACAHVISLWKRTGAVPMQVRLLVNRMRAAPEDRATRQLLAELLVREPERAERELAALDQMATLSENDPEVLRPLAALHIERGDSGRALRALERLSELDAHAAVSTLGRAVELALASSRLDEAVRLAHRAVQAQPTNPDAYRLLGRAQLRSGELTAAAQALTRASRLAPADTDTRELIALLRAQLGDSEAAAEEWLRVLTSTSQDEQAERAARGLLEYTSPNWASKVEPVLVQRASAMSPAGRRMRALLLAWYQRTQPKRVALGPVLSALDRDGSGARESALSVLVAANVPGTSARLVARLSASTSNAQLDSLLRAIVALRDPSVADALQEAVEKLDAAAQPLGLWTLLQVAPTRAHDVCARQLGSSWAAVRVFAALCSVPAAETQRDLLLRALESERDSLVQAALALGLAASGGSIPSSLPNTAGALEELRVAHLFDRSSSPQRLPDALFAPQAWVREAAVRRYAGDDAVWSIPSPTLPFEPRTYLRQVLRGHTRSTPRRLDEADGARLADAWLRAEGAPRSRSGAPFLELVGFVPTALHQAGFCAGQAYRHAWSATMSAALRDPALTPDHVPWVAAQAGALEHPAVLALLAPEADAQSRERLLRILSAHDQLPDMVIQKLLALFDVAPDWPTRLRLAQLLGPRVGAVREKREPVALVRAALRQARTPRNAAVCHADQAAN